MAGSAASASESESESESESSAAGAATAAGAAGAASAISSSSDSAAAAAAAAKLQRFRDATRAFSLPETTGDCGSWPTPQSYRVGGGGVDALEVGGIGLLAMQPGAERGDGGVGGGYASGQGVGLELHLGDGLGGVVGLEERLEKDVARGGGDGGYVALDLGVIVCLAMKLEAGNLPPVEGGDVAVGRRDLAEDGDGVGVVEVGVLVLGSRRKEEGGLGVGSEVVEAFVADDAAAAAGEVGARLEVAAAASADAAGWGFLGILVCHQGVAVEAGGDAEADCKGRGSRRSR